MDFEDSLKKIEEILARLEGGNIPLEEALSLYSQGVELSRKCREELENAKLKITEKKE
ncbi:MAG: exodeoxyribonuclease VII small subunit [Oscillospiraceae bacterium]|jgi:exodeoxyribonuclease VII small subunit|nr:exodeoxyribonuclease small subunit [Oscillospiraceae bacterium]MCX7658370.1 exodeoxyribonuclease VII small subunit [Oscillospiraceae bacterium]HOV40859.1 exodeoxyribonuclease VII small subunit [Oscillospiraceae bacterium]